MAFLLQRTEDGHVPAWEYKPCGAITPKVGLALVESSGNLAVASGTTKPEYICMAEYENAVTAGEIIPVVRVTNDIVFAAPLSEAGTSLKVGQSVTLASNGLELTATTTSGVAKIMEFEGGQAKGDIVRVVF